MWLDAVFQLWYICFLRGVVCSLSRVPTAIAAQEIPHATRTHNGVGSRDKSLARSLEPIAAGVEMGMVS